MDTNGKVGSKWALPLKFTIKIVTSCFGLFRSHQHGIANKQVQVAEVNCKINSIFESLALIDVWLTHGTRRKK